MIKAVAEKQDFEKKVLELLKEYASKKPAGIFLLNFFEAYCHQIYSL
jgi:hypothetical protein